MIRMDLSWVFNWDFDPYRIGRLKDKTTGHKGLALLFDSDFEGNPSQCNLALKRYTTEDTRAYPNLALKTQVKNV